MLRQLSTNKKLVIKITFKTCQRTPNINSYLCSMIVSGKMFIIWHPIDLEAFKASLIFSFIKKIFMFCFLFMTLSSIVPFSAQLTSLHRMTPSLRTKNTSLVSGSIGKYFLQSGSSLRHSVTTFAYACLSSFENDENETSFPSF
jgi:hypothetical protein